MNTLKRTTWDTTCTVLHSMNIFKRTTWDRTCTVLHSTNTLKRTTWDTYVNYQHPMNTLKRSTWDAARTYHPSTRRLHLNVQPGARHVPELDEYTPKSTIWGTFLLQRPGEHISTQSYWSANQVNVATHSTQSYWSANQISVLLITAASSSAHNATKAGKVKGKDSQFSSCVKMEVAVPDFLFLIASTASVDVKQH